MWGQEDERVGDQADYAWVYRLYAGRYGPWLNTIHVIPTGVIVSNHHRLLFRRHTQSSVLEASLAQSDQVQQEDIAICKMVQTGLVLAYVTKFMHPASRARCFNSTNTCSLKTTAIKTG